MTTHNSRDESQIVSSKRSREKRNLYCVILFIENSRKSNQYTVTEVTGLNKITTGNLTTGKWLAGSKRRELARNRREGLSGEQNSWWG